MAHLNPLLLSSVVIFIFGAMLGSFLNVCIARIPKRESVISPRSRCPRCQTPIPFYDNIPLISYVWLRGHCRFCSERIPARYFVVEIMMAALTVALYYQFGTGLAFFVTVIFVAALIAISFIDLDARIVPDVISLPGICLGLAISVVGRFIIHDPFGVVPTPLTSFLGILIGGGFLFALAWAYEYFTGIEGMGGGDVKLIAMIGAFLGWPAIPFTLFAASLSGSIVGLTLMIGKGVGRRFALPFAPFLCLGAVVYLFFSSELASIWFPAN